MKEIKQFLKHNNMMDVCVQVSYTEDLKDTKPGFVKVYGWWWNMSHSRAFNISEWAEIVISKNDMNNDWKVLTYEEPQDKVYKLRTALWR